MVLISQSFTELILLTTFILSQIDVKLAYMNGHSLRRAYSPTFGIVNEKTSTYKNILTDVATTPLDSYAYFTRKYLITFMSYNMNVESRQNSQTDSNTKKNYYKSDNKQIRQKSRYTSTEEKKKQVEKVLKACRDGIRSHDVGVTITDVGHFS